MIGLGGRASDRARTPAWADSLASGWSHPWSRIVPYVFALTTGVQILAFVVIQPAQIGFDARLYTAAAQAWLNGGNPWAVSDLGIFFAAPPPSLLLFAPFTLLPSAIVTVVWVAGSFVLAALALRAIGAPLWWLVWWPIVDGCLIGNANIAVLSLLLVAGRRLDALAPIAKVYAILPLLGERRWRSLAIAAAITIVTVPLLPWRLFIDDFAIIAGHLASVSASTSVYGQPVLMIVAAVALLSLGLRRASWLAVPALWPSTQPHYLAISTPAMSPLLAIAWSFPHPYIVTGSIVVEAVARFIRRPSAALESEAST